MRKKPLILLDTSIGTLLDLEQKYPGQVGQLLTPLTNYKPWGGILAADNGAFAGFDPNAFSRFIKRLKALGRCEWVAVPDALGSARRTRECFSHWFPEMEGLSLALVAQDGQEKMPIPWHLINAIFIGGTDRWKESASAEAVIRAAQIIGKWVHVGRVNGPQRLKRFQALGVDSVDGSGLVRFKHMIQPFFAALNQEPGDGGPLFAERTAKWQSPG